MGNEQSAISGDTPAAYGFHVLRNSSQAETLRDIEPWYDFIVGINGRQIDDPDPHLLALEIKNCAGYSVRLGIWSAKGQRLRDVVIPLPAGQDVNLGLTLQWTPLAVTENVWHILEVADASPAEEAGLLAYDDWIVGTPEGWVRGEAGMGELVEDHTDRPLRLYVYNSPHNVTRELTITPRRGWGGDGLLGCVLGFGALHRLPAPLSEPAPEPGEMLFDASLAPALARTATPQPPPAVPFNAFPPTGDPAQDRDGFTATPFESSGGFVPAAQLAPPMVPQPPPVSKPSELVTDIHGRKHKKNRRVIPSAMDDLLREGEEKSRELDGLSGGSGGGAGTAGLPPPPKGSIPPPPRRTGG